MSFLAVCIIFAVITHVLSDVDYTVRVDGTSNSPETYVLPGLYGGLTNQKFSLYAAAAFCILNNFTLVLPEWVFDYHSSSFISKSFDYFYTIDRERLKTMPSISHFTYVPSMPIHLLSPCLIQLQASAYDQLYPTMSVVMDYSHNTGVVCLNAEGTFYGLANIVQNQLRQYHFLDFVHEDFMQAFRSVLIVSDLYQSIVSSIMQRMKEMIGHSDFISVHARIEHDFADACKEWPKRSLSQPNEPAFHRACYETDEVMYHLLTNSVTFPVNNSVLMIMNYNKDDLEFKDLPTLCNRQCYNISSTSMGSCYVFQCVRKEFFLDDHKLYSLYPNLVRSVSSIAMIDSLLATHGILFLGNMYSTMSVEIAQDRRLGRTPYTESVYYNRLCSQHSTNYDDCP